jgi:hypothetical protein
MTTEVTKLNQHSVMATQPKTLDFFSQESRNLGQTLATTLSSSTPEVTVALMIFQITLSMEEILKTMEVALVVHSTERAR